VAPRRDGIYREPQKLIGLGYATARARWAEWAQQHVDEWPDTGRGTAPMGAKVQRENARLSGLATDSTQTRQ
jgi:hypothetical protein